MKKLLPILIIVAICLFGMVGCQDYVQSVAANCNSYTIVAGYDDTHHVLSAVQTVDFVNPQDSPLDAIKFHVYGNCYGLDCASVVPQSSYNDAYYNGASYGEVSFDSVKVNGTPVPFVIEGSSFDILSVPLSTPLQSGQSVQVEMTYQLTLANVAHRLGYGETTVNLGNFYPVLCHLDENGFACTPYYSVGDPFVTPVANYDVTLVAPSNFVVASSGNLVSSKTTGNQTTHIYQAKAIRDFAMVLSTQFTHITADANGVAVNYYYFADTNPQTTLATAVGMANYLSQSVAKYPYKQLTVVETNFCYGGMEYGNLAMVSSGGRDYLTATAHEVAHQWFYGVVGNNQIDHAWMDEGLCEFVTLLYMDKHQDQPLATAIKKLYKNYVTYVDVLTNYYGAVDVSFRPLNQYKNDTEYVYVNYVRGCLLFYTIYDNVGEARFFSSLSRYFDQAKLTIATPQQLVDSFCKGCNKDVSGIFDAFINGKDIISQGNR